LLTAEYHLGNIVITTIQAPTPSVVSLARMASEQGLRLIVIGDRKTPASAWPENANFLSLQAQLDMGYALSARLPENHYARKNLGYLLAMSQRSPLIFDTDDDNAPLQTWKARTLAAQARPCLQAGWVNAYRWFTDTHVWPRGLPLHNSRHCAPPDLGVPTDVEAPIQQGLANGSPDVDAVWRLLMDQEITFRSGDSVVLASGTWCPFNSQSTWWFPQAYPLLYLPSFVSFRMTDIWRSFIAQRCLWAMGQGLVFHGPEMFQDRNPHDLLRDFEQEVPGYLGNERFREVLEGLQLAPGKGEVPGNLHRCYDALIGAALIPAREMDLVESWLEDLRSPQAGAWSG
jgi:hypothetical protein